MGLWVIYSLVDDKRSTRAKNDGAECAGLFGKN